MKERKTLFSHLLSTLSAAHIDEIEALRECSVPDWMLHSRRCGVHGYLVAVDPRLDHESLRRRHFILDASPRRHQVHYQGHSEILFKPFENSQKVSSTHFQLFHNTLNPLSTPYIFI
ncbi:hypothetical protein BDQ12DRAFT_644109 [Crucibulum laeve]|uniref:Uncharacterized protein n=1 Tax=Crucibulum laeve TaxID=68775 RepID=A0A5C3MAD4_9AGAR|nr:hypothetical protein BDQ12DRAFT_644109 [Crucibulum laeve]